MQAQSTLNLREIFDPIEKSLESPDDMLGKGLMMPFNNTNSGSRKLLYGTQREHVIPINDAETAFIQTGSEDEYGEWSSSLKYAKGNYKLIAKVPKFSKNPGHHYFSVFVNCDTNTIEMEERRCYKHITESYGYTINNDVLDNMKIGDDIPKGKLLQKSTCYDKYNNRKDGLNLTTAYISCAKTMEDGILISRSTQKRMVTPLIHHVSIVANDNDIPLNLFGQNDMYKIFPDIGEEVPEGILIGLRRENKEEILFAQTYSRLQDIMMSDDKFTVEGTVVDIDIRCNNPDNIANNPYYSQVKYYYDEDQLFCRNFVEVIESLGSVYTQSYDVRKMYYICKAKLDKTQFIKDRLFSNVIIEITLVEQNMIQIGDKLSDRYGGKGVVVDILEDEEMPVLSNGKIVDIIFNKSTCINRLNPGQLFEVEINHIAQRLLEHMETGVLSTDQCLEQYVKFLKLCGDQYGDYVDTTISMMNDGDRELLLNDILSYSGIFQVLRPISDSFTLDKLALVLKEFSWATQYEVLVPMRNSKGERIYRKARRPIICGTKYVYRLKQYAREKFSVCSLSSTNIRNENSRSKANKMFRALYTSTPIRFGEMETGNMGHMGMEYVIINLLMYSASPHARRLAGEEILRGDPFNINVKLDSDCVNTGVQILNTLLKTIGLKLTFEKEHKDLIKPLIKIPLIKLDEQKPNHLIKPIIKVDPRSYYDPTLIDRMWAAERGESGMLKPLRRYPLIKGSKCPNKYIYSPNLPEEMEALKKNEPE